MSKFIVIATTFLAFLLHFSCSPAQERAKSGGNKGVTGAVTDPTGLDQLPQGTPAGEGQSDQFSGQGQGEVLGDGLTPGNNGEGSGADNEEGEEDDQEESDDEEKEAKMPEPGKQRCGEDVSCQIFATSARYKGNLGGLKGADEKCQAHAKSAGLKGFWAALISTSSMNAKDKIMMSGIVKNIKNETIIGLNKFFSSDTLDNSIRYDENGQKTYGSRDVWTGTNPTGLKNAKNCSNWSISNPSILGLVGASSEELNGSHLDDFEEHCEMDNRLYCVSVEPDSSDD